MERENMKKKLLVICMLGILASSTCFGYIRATAPNAGGINGYPATIDDLTFRFSFDPLTDGREFRIQLMDSTGALVWGSGSFTVSRLSIGMVAYDGPALNWNEPYTWRVIGKLGTRSIPGRFTPTPPVFADGVVDMDLPLLVNDGTSVCDMTDWSIYREDDGQLLYSFDALSLGQDETILVWVIQDSYSGLSSYELDYLDYINPNYSIFLGFDGLWNDGDSDELSIYDEYGNYIDSVVITE